MKRERPPIPPLAVRLRVAERQYRQIMPARAMGAYRLLQYDWSLSRRLSWLLFILFRRRGKEPHLDHDPALILRLYSPRIKDVAARYTPHAHDPYALIYREKAEHQQKTTGRKPGALRTVTTKGSDVGLKTKFARLERKSKKKARIPSRPFPKGRGFS